MNLPRLRIGLDAQKKKHFKSIQRNNPDITPHTYAYTRSAWLTSRSTALIDAKRYDDARRDCEEAILIAPFNHMAYIKLGIVYFYAGDVNRAIEEMKKAPHYTESVLGEREDNRLDILYWMGMIYGKSERYDDAVKYFRTALSLPEQNSFVDSIELPDTKSSLQQRQEQRDEMEEFIKLYEEDKANALI